MAAAVDQHQGTLRAEAAQIEQAEAGGAEEAGRVRLAEGAAQRGQFVQRVTDRGTAGLEEFLAVDRGDRNGAFEVGAADTRTGDDDLVAGGLRVELKLLLGRGIGGGRGILHGDIVVAILRKGRRRAGGKQGSNGDAAQRRCVQKLELIHETVFSPNSEPNCKHSPIARRCNICWRSWNLLRMLPGGHSQAAPVSLARRRGSMPSCLNAAAHRSSVGVSNRMLGSTRRGEPAVPGHLVLKLARPPAGIAERDQPPRRPPPFGNGAKHVDRAGHRPQLAARPDDLKRILAAPIVRMKHEAASRLDRAAVVDRRVGASPGSSSSCFNNPRSRIPARLWLMPMPTAPFSSWTQSAETLRSNLGSAMPGMASSSFPARNGASGIP